MIEYLMDSFIPMMEKSDEIIRNLFGDPMNGGDSDEKSGGDSGGL